MTNLKRQTLKNDCSEHMRRYLIHSPLIHLHLMCLGKFDRHQTQSISERDLGRARCLLWFGGQLWRQPQSTRVENIFLGFFISITIAESDDDDTDEESEEDDLEQVLETQQKRKRASASHFDASSPDSGKEQSKKKAKTAASATAEFKPPSRSGTLPSRGTVASPSGTSTTARSLGSRLAKVAGPKKK